MLQRGNAERGGIPLSVKYDKCYFSPLNRLAASGTPYSRTASAASAARFRAGSKAFSSWAVKQEIKNELFGDRRIAIEVFPTKKNLVDACDVYHLWLLPKGTSLPFGIHPARDPQGTPVERGYDFDLDKVKEWTESEERKRLLDENT